MPRRAVLALLITAAAPGAVIDGVVVDQSTGRPLARAQVALGQPRPGGASPIANTLADSAGRFSFPDIAPGAYLVSAKRAGWAESAYGQKRWNASGSPIVLDAKGRFYCEIRLMRAGVIAGVVWDENQIGLPGATVLAYAAGRYPLSPAGSGVSDDRGAYRIPGLAPGLYYVRTGPRKLEDGQGLLPTFFGQTLKTQEARTVKVELDAETTGVDIQPAAGALARLTGLVAGGPAAWVSLCSDAGKREAMPGADGRFSFDQLAPGDYELLAHSAAGTARMAFRRITLGSGPHQADLYLAPVPSVRIRVETLDGSRVDAGSVGVFLKRRGLSRDYPAPSLRGDGVVAAFPGEFEAQAAAPAGYYVESIQAPGGGQAWNGFDVAPGESVELVVRLAGRAASLKGKVLLRDGRPAPRAPVFLRAADAQVRARGGIRVARTDEDGAFEINSLPPGAYQVFSSFEYADPTEEDWERAPARTVGLEAEQQTNIELELVGPV